MLKYQSLLAGAAGALLLVPTFATQDKGGGLERSLQETVRAMEVLLGIQKGIEQRSPNAIPLLLQATEAPNGEAQARDEQLHTLREEVSRLQGVADRMVSTEEQALKVNELLQANPDDAKKLIVSTGLSAADRAALQGRSPANATAPIEHRTGAGAYGEADPLRQAQALYRGGRYADCVVFLDSKAKQPEAAWWRARALEQLNRWPEAIDGYRVATSSTDPLIARRAKQDLEFLEWKRDFQAKAPKTANKQEQPR